MLYIIKFQDSIQFAILFSRRWKKEQQKADLLHPAYRQQAAAAAAAAASYMNAQGPPGRPPPGSYLASKSAGLGRYCSLMCSRIETCRNQLKGVAVLLGTTQATKGQKMSQPGKSLLAEPCSYFLATCEF